MRCGLPVCGTVCLKYNTPFEFSRCDWITSVASSNKRRGRHLAADANKKRLGAGVAVVLTGGRQLRNRDLVESTKVQQLPFRRCPVYDHWRVFGVASRRRQSRGEQRARFQCEIKTNRIRRPPFIRIDSNSDLKSTQLVNRFPSKARFQRTNKRKLAQPITTCNVRSAY